MQVSVEATNGLECKMTVKIPSSEVEQKVATKLQDLAKNVKMDGFRPGKVPFKMVQQRYGSGVRQEVLSDMMRDTLYQAIQEQQLSPAGMPALEPIEVGEGKDLEYVATFEIFPKFEVTALDNCEIEQITANITPADIDAMFDKLRKQHTEWQETDSAAKQEHKVNIDFEGFINDEKFSGGNATSYELVLGAGSMIPGFEDNIIGAKSGSNVTANTTFPENYPHAAIAGKPVKFDITVNKVFAPKLPELNDAFAAKFDVKEGGIEKLRQEISNSMQHELEMQLQDKNKQFVFDQLLAKNDIAIPKALLDQEIQLMQQELYRKISGDKKVDKSQLPTLPRDLFEVQAKKRVQLGLIVDQYIKQHHIKLDREQLEQKLDKLATAYDDPAQWKLWYRESKQRVANLEASVLEEQVVAALIKDAKINEKLMDYFSVVNTNKNYEDDISHEHVHGPDCDHDHEHE